MVALLREAEKMAESVGDQRRLGGAYSQLSTALWMASDHEQALEFARKALALAEASNIFALRKAALHNYAMIHHAMAEYGVVLAVITIAVFGALALLSGNIVNAVTRVAGYIT